MIKNLVDNYLLKTQSRKDTLTLITGTSIAQIITIVTAPILTRLFSPEDFGVLALFLSVATILGSISTGKYELAIVLPEKEEDAKYVFNLGLVINTAFSLVLFAIVALFHGWLVRISGNEEISFWLYIIPVVVFMTGLFNLLNYYNIRLGTFKVIASVKASRSLVSSALQIVFGVLKLDSTGLLVGNILGNFWGNKMLYNNVFKGKDFNKYLELGELKRVAKKYSDFPKWSSWGILINTSSQNVTNIFLSIFFNVSSLGFYSLANRVLGMPLTLVGESVKQVFMKNITKAKNSKGNSIKEFDITFRSLAIITVPLFVGLFFTVVPVFRFVFGPEWEEAGRYVQILAPFFAVRFVSTNLSITTIVFEKQLQALVIQVVIFLAAILPMAYALVNKLSVVEYLEITTISLSIVYLVCIFYYRKIAKGED